MFEDVKDIETLQKIIRGNGEGTGVAIMCPGEIIQKFKVKAFSIICTEDKVQIKGVKLIIPNSIAMSAEAIGDAFIEDKSYWFKPEKVYRNKGDCARANAEEKLAHLEEKIKQGVDLLNSLDLGSVVNQSMMKLYGKKEELLNEFRKKKWFKNK